MFQQAGGGDPQPPPALPLQSAGLVRAPSATRLGVGASVPPAGGRGSITPPRRRATAVTVAGAVTEGSEPGGPLPEPPPLSHVRGLLARTAQKLGSTVRYREQRWVEAATEFSAGVRRAADLDAELLVPLGGKLAREEKLIRHAILDKQRPHGIGFQRRLVILTNERLLCVRRNRYLL